MDNNRKTVIVRQYCNIYFIRNMKTKWCYRGIHSLWGLWSHMKSADITKLEYEEFEKRLFRELGII